MKISNSNPTGIIVSSILMIIGAGAILGFFFNKKNGIITKKEAKQTGKYIAQQFNNKGKKLKNKVKDQVDASKSVLKEVTN
jgi:hypothetical protein